MSNRLVVLVEASPDPQAATAWAVRACGAQDMVVLVAPWRRGQSEVDPVSGAFLDAPTAAHLRLLRERDRARALRPEARLRLAPMPGSPRELLPRLSREADLIVLAARPPSRWRRRGQARSATLLALAECPVVVVRSTAGGAEALLATATGLRQEEPADLHRRQARP